MREISEEDFKLWEKYKTMIYGMNSNELTKNDEQSKYDALLDANKLEIDKHVGSEDWSTEGIYGWECKKSPLNVCVYYWAEHDEDCVYCGYPEERK